MGQPRQCRVPGKHELGLGVVRAEQLVFVVVLRIEGGRDPVEAATEGMLSVIVEHPQCRRLFLIVGIIRRMMHVADPQLFAEAVVLHRMQDVRMPEGIQREADGMCVVIHETDRVVLFQGQYAFCDVSFIQGSTLKRSFEANLLDDGDVIFFVDDAHDVLLPRRECGLDRVQEAGERV